MSCSVCLGYDSYNCPCCGEGVRMVTCPDCKGKGHYGYFAFDTLLRTEEEVSKLTYAMLPDDEDMADALSWRFCKMPLETCDTCGGSGKVPEE